VTFDTNLVDRRELLAELLRQSEKVSRRLRAQELMASTVVVKIRDAGFRTVTRSRSMRACSNSTRTLYRMARALFESWREKHRTTPVRLIGMGVTGLEQESGDGKAAGDRLDSSTEIGNVVHIIAVLLAGAPIRSMGSSSRTQHKPVLGASSCNIVLQRVLEEDPILRTG